MIEEPLVCGVDEFELEPSLISLKRTLCIDVKPSDGLMVFVNKSSDFYRLIKQI